MTDWSNAICETMHSSLETWFLKSPTPKVLGICGSQGSGKSTLARQISDFMSERGRRVAVLSLDDLYLSSNEREKLGKTLHPLFRTRGVPGTHDVQLGIDIIEQLKSGAGSLLPRFDKSSDNPFPSSQWERISGSVDIIIFEGWCVGAAPEQSDALVNPLNELERNHDQDAIWRVMVNEFLAGPYQRLFSLIDRLVLLAAPSFDIVKSWRVEQENTLIAHLSLNGQSGDAIMSASDIEIFVQHYERISRHILREMPTRADFTVFLDEARSPKAYK